MNNESVNRGWIKLELFHGGEIGSAKRLIRNFWHGDIRFNR